MAYGMKGHVGICFQQSYGTAYTSSMDYFPVISENLDESIGVLVSEGMTGRLEEGASYEGAHNVAGDIVTEVHPLLFPKLLKAWTNHASGTLVGSMWTHVIAPNQADFDDKCAVPPCTIEVYRDSGSAYQYSDMALNGLAVEIANGTIIKATASWVGGQFAWIEKSAPSYDTGSYYTWDSTSVSIGGAADDALRSLSVTMTNNIENTHTLNGTKYGSRVKRTGYRTMEISGTILFEDDTDAKLFRAFTRQEMILTATGATITGSQSNSIKIDVPSFLYTTYPAAIGGAGLIEVGFSGKAEYHTGSASMVEFTAVNTKAGY